MGKSCRPEAPKRPILPRPIGFVASNALISLILILAQALL
jgi:hypothetical protein